MRQREAGTGFRARETFLYSAPKAGSFLGTNERGVSRSERVEGSPRSDSLFMCRGFEGSRCALLPSLGKARDRLRLAYGCGSLGMTAESTFGDQKIDSLFEGGDFHRAPRPLCCGRGEVRVAAGEG
jgi:hypothetical protein